MYRGYRLEKIPKNMKELAYETTDKQKKGNRVIIGRKRKRNPAVSGNHKITLVELTYIKAYTRSIPLCPVIYSGTNTLLARLTEGVQPNLCIKKLFPFGLQAFEE